MGGDFGMIFVDCDEGIFFHIPEEQYTKSARKIPQIFFSTLRIGSLLGGKKNDQKEDIKKAKALFRRYANNKE